MLYVCTTPNPIKQTTLSTETPKKETPTTQKTDDQYPLIGFLLFSIGGCLADEGWYLQKKDVKDQNRVLISRYRRIGHPEQRWYM